MNLYKNVTELHNFSQHKRISVESNPWSIEFCSQQNNNLIVVTVTLKFKLANNQAEPHAHPSKLWVMKISYKWHSLGRHDWSKLIEW